ncbi:MAG: hypothetical protein JW875_09975 [Spirochaetales bacterium]|nr:hypothetical protein [Spirochaetales bacterium]
MTLTVTTEHQGKTVLALNTAMDERSFGRSRLQSALNDEGLLIDQHGQSTPWRFEGSYSSEGRDGSIHLWGDAFTGESLLDTILTSAREQAWSIFHFAISLIIKDPRSITAASRTGPAGILVAPNQAVLILPPSVISLCLEGMGEAVVLKERGYWTYPDPLPDNRNFTLMVGLLAYRILSGTKAFDFQESPYTGKRGEIPHTDLINFLMRKVIMLPIELHEPRLKKQVAQTINNLCDRTCAASPDILLAYGPDSTLLHDASPNGADTEQHTARLKQDYIKKNTARIERKKFWTRYSHVILASIAGCAVVTFLIISIVSAQLSGPTTEGMESKEVALGFYKAITNLDHQTADAYVAHDDLDYISFARTLFVQSRMRLNYEGKWSVISPEDFFTAKTAQYKSIYGISNLNITGEKTGDTLCEYEVSFYYWIPMPPDGDKTSQEELEQEINAGKEPLTVWFHRDKLMLTRTKKGWIISEMIPLSREIVERSIEEVTQALQNTEKPVWMDTE